MQPQSETIGRRPRIARAVSVHAGAHALPPTAGRRHPVGTLAAHRKSLIHQMCLTLVFLAVASSGIVFTEPSPTDAISMGLVALLPTVGLVAITPLLTGYLSAWLLAAAAGFFAATMAGDAGAPATFTFVSLYLYLSSFVIAAFIAKQPLAHTELILRAWLLAALLATAAGLVGYFNLLPGAFDMFTRFGRAAGTFKDPNVFGPFLVAPILYALHVAINRTHLRAILPLAIAGVLALGVFLSFSRGAWLCLALALAIYGWLAYVTAQSEQYRTRILLLLAVGAALIGAVIMISLQNDGIVELLTQRASLTQSYDVGPEGRFGGQEKAIGLIAENPFGIGATIFTAVHHHEEVHNVYLSILLNAGWVGGGIYWIMTLLTIVLGLRYALTRTPAQPLLLIAYAAFVANAMEGIIIDLDHWRHVYLLMAIVWGIIAADRHQAGPTCSGPA